MPNSRFPNAPSYQLVYISGSGRSGSTLLERIIHSSGDVFACGEFHCLWRLSLKEMTCSCGQAVADDGVWADILEDADIGVEQIAELERLEHSISRLEFLIRHRFDPARLRKNVNVLRFLDLQRQIWDSIAERTGARIIVDSSKAGPRAWILALLANMHTVHLYRDPGDVIASWRSRKFDVGLNSTMQRLSVPRAAIDWAKVEILARMLARRHDVVMIDYTRLCTDPVGTVEGLSRKLGLRKPILPRWRSPSSFAPGDNYHSLNGNPDRFVAGDVTVKLRKPPALESKADALLARVIGGALRRSLKPPLTNGA